MRPQLSLLAGIVATLSIGALWHGPLGAGDRAAAQLEGDARAILDHYEMLRVGVRMERAPLRRSLILTGPADDFQRGEIVRLLDQLPGTGEARWDTRPVKGSPLPLLLEAELFALVGFSIGLIFAYLMELRRRAHQWDRF